MPNPLGYLIFGMTSLLPLATTITILPDQIHQIKANPKGQRRATGLVLLAALFFALGSGIVILQLDWIPHVWAILAIGIDLEILGFAIAYLDAFDQGETLLPDFLRSLTVSALIALLFGGQVAFAVTISTGPTYPMMGLLFVTISAAIAIQVFSDPLQNLFDQLFFARLPHLRQERAELRGVAAAMPLISLNTSLLSLNETEFTRLTRRASATLATCPNSLPARSPTTPLSKNACTRAASNPIPSNVPLNLKPSSPKSRPADRRWQVGGCHRRRRCDRLRHRAVYRPATK